MNSRWNVITRRTLLEGLGVTMALPWLESLSGSGAEASFGVPPAAFPKRLAVLFMGNGISPNN